MINKKHLISEIAVCFSRVHNKLNKLEKQPASFGKREMLYAAELHAIEAIGKKRGTTVSELCDLFGTTKGAVSQTISKLEKKHYVYKERNKENGKEINISLTDKGWNIFNNHQSYHDRMDKGLLDYLEIVPKEKIADFIELLSHIEKYIDDFH
jgi:DNA-binding MarR family transcriptional regulator